MLCTMSSCRGVSLPPLFCCMLEVPLNEQVMQCASVWNETRLRVKTLFFLMNQHIGVFLMHQVFEHIGVTEINQSTDSKHPIIPRVQFCSFFCEAGSDWPSFGIRAPYTKFLKKPSHTGISTFLTLPSHSTGRHALEIRAQILLKQLSA